MAEAHRIKSEQEALEAARRIAEQIRPGSAARDKERRLPFEEIEWFSQSGLWGITVPKEYGGAGVSTATFTEVVAIISEADASVGQIPQNHYANVEEIRLIGTEAQKVFFFDRISQGRSPGKRSRGAFRQVGLRKPDKSCAGREWLSLDRREILLHWRSLC